MAPEIMFMARITFGQLGENGSESDKGILFVCKE